MDTILLSCGLTLTLNSRPSADPDSRRVCTPAKPKTPRCITYRPPSLSTETERDSDWGLINSPVDCDCSNVTCSVTDAPTRNCLSSSRGMRSRLRASWMKATKVGHAAKLFQLRSALEPTTITLPVPSVNSAMAAASESVAGTVAREIARFDSLGLKPSVL